METVFSVMTLRFYAPFRNTPGFRWIRFTGRMAIGWFQYRPMLPDTVNRYPTGLMKTRPEANEGQERE